MVVAAKKLSSGWSYDAVSVGYPGPVLRGRPVANPKNLGGGWVGFDFRKACGKPVRLVNDAAMQALGSYGGGRMLFLGLGTGLGVRRRVGPRADGARAPSVHEGTDVRGLRRAARPREARQEALAQGGRRRGRPARARARGGLRRPRRRQREAPSQAPEGRATRRQRQRVPRRLPALEGRGEARAAAAP